MRYDVFISCILPTPPPPPAILNPGMIRESQLFRTPPTVSSHYTKPEADMHRPPLPSLTLAPHSSIASESAWKPGGSLPSFSIFSNRMISSRLLAFLIISCSFFFSASVSFIRASFDDVSAGPFASAAAGPLDFCPRI